MALLAKPKKVNLARALVGFVGIVVLTAACSSSDSSSPTAVGLSDEATPVTVAAVGTEFVDDGSVLQVVDKESVAYQSSPTSVSDARIIRDGRVDIRIDAGTFGSKAEELRAIAADLGGYISSGETQLQQLEDSRYAVGWYTMRIPSDRYDEAVGRVERMGEPVSASLSSQDVTEEYVDLEGRLDYWRTQEQFYLRLLEEATTVDELISVQTRMQDVLLNIEQIEGRLRYLDSRTNFATLTVGLTEVPDSVIAPVLTNPGPISEAFDQAGEVLLATVAFFIVAAAVVIPIAAIALVVFAVSRPIVNQARRKAQPEA